MSKPEPKRAIDPNQLCSECRAENHEDHTDSGGSCRNDNRYEEPCRCPMRGLEA